MRTLIGIILGVFLTLGVAYIHDVTITPSTDPNRTVDARPMVNWDVVSANWQDFKMRVDVGWRKLQSLG